MLGGRETMPATISFTLPNGLGATELPPRLLELAASRSDGKIVLETREPLADVKALADWALGRGLDLPDLDVRRPSLEDVYLQLTEDARPGGGS
jgi:ABC-2 type transport system ATP-binding protein